jgi:hypothetical protein
VGILNPHMAGYRKGINWDNYTIVAYLTLGFIVVDSRIVGSQNCIPKDVVIQMKFREIPKL